LPEDKNANVRQRTSQRTVRKAEEKIQQQLNKIQKWANSWRVKLNATKSQALFINHPHSQDRRLREPPRLSLSNRLISLSNSVRYLGINFTHTCSLKSDLQITLKKTGGLQLPNTRSHLQHFYPPLIEYRAPLYASLPSRLQNQIAFCERKILRMIFRLHFRHPSHLVHSDTNTTSILTRLTTFQQKYINRTEKNNNSLARQNLCVTFKIPLTTRINRHFNFLRRIPNRKLRHPPVALLKAKYPDLPPDLQELVEGCPLAIK
ncbi:hypothetical protein BDFB_013386, partial [Asbolus verrucosus]